MALVAAVGSEDDLVIGKLAEVREVGPPDLRFASIGAPQVSYEFINVRRLTDIP
ncbi:hypothetical protein D3C87_1098520 [compost metagenome]